MYSNYSIYGDYSNQGNIEIKKTALSMRMPFELWFITD